MYCEECEVTWEYASIRCPDCRSRLVKPGNWLAQICESAPNLDAIHVGDAIPERKADNVRAHYPIGDDNLLLLIDSTVFGSAKVGLAIGSKGIYWSTDWTTSSKRHSLNWAAFADRKLELSGYHVELGQGDVLDLAAIGYDEHREVIFKFLERLQTAARARLRQQK